MRSALTGVSLLSLLLLCDCAPTESPYRTVDLGASPCDFLVYWPPQDPEETAEPLERPLLNGTLQVVVEEDRGSARVLRLVLTLTRPSTEADREHWNSMLAFSNVPWMDDVRVWDPQHTWIWPNLPYLLRLPGQERVERYGGLDPGKHVDNDFAAVLIRKYDAAGAIELPDTSSHPLVSAEWHPVGVVEPAGRTVVHAARSDQFRLHVGRAATGGRGRIKVWLIYADFLWSDPPPTWPQEREFAGGILAYFEIDWAAAPNRPLAGSVRQRRPREGTGFDWGRWVVREPGSDRAKAAARLSDMAQPGRSRETRTNCALSFGEGAPGGSTTGP